MEWNKTMEIDAAANQGFVAGVPALERKGKYSESLDEANKTIAAAGRTPWTLAALAYTLASAGKRDEAQKIATELENRWKEHYFPPAVLALMYAGLGDADRAFAWLDTAYQEHDGQLVWLAVEPQFAPLHRDRSWVEQITRLNLVVSR